MSRLLRWVFRATATVSVLLFTLTCVVWLRSYRLSDCVLWHSSGALQSIHSAPGCAVAWLHWTNRSDQPADELGIRYRRDSIGWMGNGLLDLDQGPGDTNISWERAGFAFYEMREAAGPVYVIVVIPFWSIALATAAMPLGAAASWLAKRRRARRSGRRGLCPACGYDLRATPHCCPECGTVPAGKAAT